MTMKEVKMTNNVPAKACTRAEAEALTERIKSAADGLWAMLLEAYERQAHMALGYASWSDYIAREFSMSRRRSYQLLEQGRAIAAIRGVVPEEVRTDVHISEAAAREIKDDLPAVAAEIRSRVADGDKPDEAVAGVIAEARRVKAEQKADIARRREETAAQFSPEVQEHRARTEEYRAQTKVAKAPPSNDIEALRAEIEEKDEYIASLETEIADLTRQIAKFDDMAVQYEQGGFEKIIAGRDEEIRVLETRLYSTNADMVSWKKKAAWEIKEKLRYKHEAEKRGFVDEAGNESGAEAGAAA